MLKKNILIFLLVFLVILIFKFPVLDVPYSEDAIAYTIPASLYIYDHNLNPLIGGDLAFGHTPLFFELLAILFKIFGPSIVVARLLVIFFTAVALLFTYLVGKELFNAKVGVISAILLFFSPTFFAQSGLVSLAVPSTALILIVIYFVLKNNKLMYLLFMCLAILFRDPNVIIISAIFLYVFIKNYKKKKFFKNLIVYSSPVLLILLWMVLNKALYGWFLHPEYVRFRIFNLERIFFTSLKLLKYIFFDDYKWILTSIILFSSYSNQQIRKIFKNKMIFIYLILSSIFFILLSYVKLLSNTLNKYFLYGNNYLDLLFNLRVFFSFLFLSFLSIKKKFFKDWLNIKTLIPILMIFTYVAYFSPWKAASVKYLLPVYPLFFILGSRAITRLFKKKILLYSFLIMIVVLFISSWSSDREFHGDIGSNMEYLDVVKTHKAAIDFIETNYSNSTILISGYVQMAEFSSPRFGYIKKSLKYKELTDLKKIPDFDIFLYTPYLPEEKRNQIIKYLNLTLVRRFEINNKFTEIYKK